MPRRKASRAPVRAKPTILDDSTVIVDLEAEVKAKKMELLLKDFDAQVERRVAKMQEDLLSLEESIRHMYKADLNRYSAATKNMLWNDYIKENEKPRSAMRESIAHTLSAAENILSCAVRNKGRGKAKTNANNELPPPSATKSTRNTKVRAVLDNNQTGNILPPPSTSRAPRSCKVNLEVAATPANRGISGNHFSSMMVTPKFDPRTPLPPGTVKRKPDVGEIAISLKGSPLSVTPDVCGAPLRVTPKDWISNLETADVDEETRAELLMFHERVGKLLNL